MIPSTYPGLQYDWYWQSATAFHCLKCFQQLFYMNISETESNMIIFCFHLHTFFPNYVYATNHTTKYKRTFSHNQEPICIYCVTAQVKIWTLKWLPVASWTSSLHHLCMFMLVNVSVKGLYVTMAVSEMVVTEARSVWRDETFWYN